MQSQLKRKLVFGGVAAACVAGSVNYLASQHQLTPATLAPVLGPAAILFLLWQMAPYTFALPTLQEAISAHSLAESERALQILDGLDRSIWRRRMAPNIAYLRSLISFQQGDLAASRQALDRTMSLPLGLISRPERQVIRASTRALRALVAALQGDAAQAEADLRGAEADPDGMADVPAMAAMARGFLLLRQGRVAEARAHIASNRRLLTMATQGDVRALARALLRPWSIPEASVYRAQGHEAEAPAVGQAAWLLKVAPSLRDLLSPRDEDEPQAVVAAAPPARPPSFEATPPTRPVVTAGRTLKLWGFLVLMFAFVWGLLGSPSAPARLDQARPAPGGVPPMLYVGFVGLTAAVFVWSMRRSKATQQNLNRGDIALARGDDEAAAAIFRQMLADSNAAINRVTGAQRMASLANLHGDHDEALRWCDEAQKLLTSARLSGVLWDQTVVNEKTLALVVQDRIAEAKAEIEALERRAPESLFLPSMRFTVELLEAVRAGDLARAGSLARGRSGGLMLGAHVELLAEAAQLATDEAAGRSQLAGLLHELAQDERIGAWIQRVAPALVERVRARALAGA